MAKKAGPGAGIHGQWRSLSPERSPGCRMGAAFPIASTKVHTGYEGDSAGTEQPGRDNQLQDGRWAVPLRAFPYRGSRCRCRLALLEPDSAPAYHSGRKLYFLPPGIDKGAAVKRLRIEREQSLIVCAGDSEMDVTMLESADLALLPAEGIPSFPSGRACCRCPASVSFPEFVFSCAQSLLK